MIWLEKNLIQTDLLLPLMTQKSISTYNKPADSVSLAKLAGQIFEIVKVEESDYDGQKGKKITTKISYDIDGKKQNKFHTTRYAIVATLDKPEVIADLEKGNTLGPVKCELTDSKKGGKPYWMLVDAIQG